jgi:hypothetical protein
MSKALPKRHAGSPLVTNAAHNRSMALECWQAGMTSQQIAVEWPEVWKLDAEGKLAQRYDYELADGSGRFETRRLITRESVKAAIAKHAK